jgi:hypothetical protein
MQNENHGKTSVVVALLGNTIVTVLKTTAAILTGSTTLFAESVHSLADTLNQSLLLIGLNRSKKPADRAHGYGYGIERFFWSLISACGILFIGAGVTDVWGWLTDVACSNPGGGHCIGRRTGKPIPCEDCDRGVVIDDKA